MKRLAYSFLIIATCLFVVDRIGGWAMQWVSSHSNDVMAPKLHYIEDRIHEDVILMGASRCHHHYFPPVIADSLGMSVYNAGIGGANNIYSHYIVLNHILARHVPKVICLEVMPTDYNQQSNPFNVVSFFAPLFGRNEEADSVYHLAGTYWRYKLSHLYRYNAKASSNLWGLVLNRQKKSEDGYMPLPEPVAFPVRLSGEEKDTTVDSQKMTYLRRFVSLCRQHNIKLLFTVSPKYSKVSPSHYETLRKFADDHSVPFLDYHTVGLYQDHPEYFKDVPHLWHEGAMLFSAVFAHDLKEKLGL